MFSLQICRLSGEARFFMRKKSKNGGVSGKEKNI